MTSEKETICSSIKGLFAGWWSNHIWHPENRLSAVARLFFVPAGIIGFVTTFTQQWFYSLFTIGPDTGTVLAVLVFFSFSLLIWLYLALYAGIVRSLHRERNVSKEACRRLSELEKTTSDLAHVAHVFAEEVRRASSQVEVQWARPLDALCEFLREHCEIEKPTVVIKRLKRDASGRWGLQTVWVSGNTSESRPVGRSQSTKSSRIYTLLKKDNRYYREVVIPDTEALSEDQESYKRDAEARGFRSVIGFPVRGPRDRDSFRRNQVLGILTIDSPLPHAFDRWFAPGSNFAHREIKPLRDLEIFYFAADSIATMIHELVWSEEKGQSASYAKGGP